MVTEAITEVTATAIGVAIDVVIIIVDIAAIVDIEVIVIAATTVTVDTDIAATTVTVDTAIVVILAATIVIAAIVLHNAGVFGSSLAIPITFMDITPIDDIIIAAIIGIATNAAIDAAGVDVLDVESVGYAAIVTRIMLA